MRVIGLTGSIACGKSTVSDAIREYPDCRVIDGDALSRELTAPGGEALAPIREVFGAGVFLSDGTLNRKALGQLVFSDFRSRAQLDQLMAPMLERLTRERIEAAREDGAVLCFLDYPLLFEKGYDRLCDTVWCVWLPRDVQMRRLMARDGLTQAEAAARIGAVLSSDEKASRSQVVIDNTGSPGYTLSLLPALLENERQQANQVSQANSSRRRRAARYEAEAGGADAADSADSAAGAARSGAALSSAGAGSSAGGTSDAAESPAPATAGARRRQGDEAALADWQREPQPPAAAPSAPAPTGPVFAPSGIPAAMRRPEAARKKPSERKAVWRMPSWLITLLLIAAFLLLCCITAQSLMNAYLTRRADQHAAEERAILANYPLDYRELLEAQAAENNLSPAFVAAIVRNESSFQPLAESSVGARGLMQLMPDTAEWIAHKLKMEGYHFDRMWDPESNVRFGCWYLNYLSSLFRGDPVSVACAYHAGQGTVTAWLSDPLISGDGVTLDLARLPDGPTKTYAGRVTKAYGIYQVLYYEMDGSLSDDLPAAER